MLTRRVGRLSRGSYAVMVFHVKHHGPRHGHGAGTPCAGGLAVHASWCRGEARSHCGVAGRMEPSQRGGRGGYGMASSGSVKMRRLRSLAGEKARSPCGAGGQLDWREGERKWTGGGNVGRGGIEWRTLLIGSQKGECFT